MYKGTGPYEPNRVGRFRINRGLFIIVTYPFAGLTLWISQRTNEKSNTEQTNRSFSTESNKIRNSCAAKKKKSRLILRSAGRPLIKTRSRKAQDTPVDFTLSVARQLTNFENISPDIITLKCN